MSTYIDMSLSTSALSHFAVDECINTFRGRLSFKQNTTRTNGPNGESSCGCEQIPRLGTTSRSMSTPGGMQTWTLSRILAEYQRSCTEAPQVYFQQREHHLLRQLLHEPELTVLASTSRLVRLWHSHDKSRE